MKTKTTQNVVRLSDARNRSELTKFEGEELLKELVLAADGLENSNDYYIAFIAAIKALNDSKLDTNTVLNMRVSFDRETEVINFKFNFESKKQNENRND